MDIRLPKAESEDARRQNFEKEKREEAVPPLETADSFFPFAEEGGGKTELDVKTMQVQDSLDVGIGTENFLDEYGVSKTVSTPPHQVAQVPSAPVSSVNMPIVSSIAQKFSRKKLWLIASLLFIFGGVFLGMWGSSWYVRHMKSYPVLAILPENPALVVEINIDSKSKEYALLEKHASAFPGYGLLKKSIDPIGEGKTLSQVFQDSFKRFNLDFEGDIRSVLGDSAYVVVADMSPVGESLHKSTIAYGEALLPRISNLFSFEKNALAFAKKNPVTQPFVLGEMTVRGSDEDFALEEPLDFLVASPIRDMDAAKKVFRTMQSNTAFDVQELTYKGFSYYKTTLNNLNTENDDIDDTSRFVRFRDLYHAIVGGNWVMASSEKELQGILSRHTLRSLRETFGQGSTRGTFADNREYHTVQKEIGSPLISDALLIGYFGVASENFFKGRDDTASDFFQYPRRMVFGWSIGFSDDGLDMVFTNATQGDALAGISEKNRLSNHIPQKANGKWVNIFFEHGGIRNRFYNFKRTALTDEGRSQWETIREEVRKSTTLDIERDIVDRIVGATIVSVLTAKNSEPEGVVVVHIDDPQAIRTLINKLAEFVRRSLSEERVALDKYDKDFGAAECSLIGDAGNRSYCLENAQSFSEMNTNAKRDLDAMIASAVVRETMTPEGVIYSFKLSDTFPYSLFSFDFGFRGNALILGSHFSATETFLREMGVNGTEGKLFENDFYQQAKIGDFEKSYQNSFVATTGIWHIIQYVSGLISKEMALRYDNLSDTPSGGFVDAQKNVDDATFAIGAILRTIKIIGNNSISRNNFETVSSRFIVESLPAEEKSRAENIINSAWEKKSAVPADVLNE